MYRARGFLRSSFLKWALYVSAFFAAILPPVLVVILALVVQMLGQSGSTFQLKVRWLPLDWFVALLPLDLRMANLVLIAALIVAAVVNCLTLLVYRRTAQKCAVRAARHLREAVFHQAYRLGTVDPLGDRHTRPEKLATETVGTVRRALSVWWATIPYCPLVLVGLLLVALLSSPWLALLAALLVVFVWQRFVALRTRAGLATRYWSERSQGAERGLLDELRLIPLSISYMRNGAADELPADAVRELELAETQMANARFELMPRLLLVIVLAGGFLLTVLSLSPDISVSGAVLLGTALLCGFFPAARLYRLPALMREGEQAAGEIFRYLEREPGVAQVSTAQPLGRLRIDLVLKDVTLADPRGGKLLDQCSSVIRAGERVAFLSSKPESATALAGLMVRLYDPAAGHILFDGTDIEHATLRALRQQVLLVPNDGMIFRATANENISCGEARFTVLQITDAAKQARAYNFLQELPHGFATRLGRDGESLLVGQAFRVGLARALIRDPSVLVILEPREKIDDKSAMHIDEALRLASEGRTILIVPTRLSTLQWADRIVLIDQGRVVAEGKHDDLLHSNELYRHLLYIRFEHRGSATPTRV
jgi:ABC-type multidrug transport system fused ATPase/permease subunit